MGLVVIQTLAIRAENVDRIIRNAFGRTEVHMTDGRTYSFDLPLAAIAIMEAQLGAARRALGGSNAE